MSIGDDPAYPAAVPDSYDVMGGCSKGFYAPGLTKREAFAMAAMEGFLASDWKVRREVIAHEAVEQADALLAALEESE